MPDGCKPNDCSLREAIIAANKHAGPDVVQLKKGTYDLAVTGAGENLSKMGDLDITKKVTVQGKSPGDTVIHAHSIERVFDVQPGATGVVLKDLALRGGLAPGMTPLEGGGAILNQGELRLQNLLVRNNTATDGYGSGISNLGTLTIENSRLTNNVGGPNGGALANSGGVLVISDSRIDHNGDASECCGGAIYNEVAGKTTIKNSKFDHNKNACCGPIHSKDPDSSLKVSNSVFIENTSHGCCGGAISASGGSSLRVTKSEFLRNTTEGCCGGAIYGQTSNASVTKSKFLDNTTEGCCGGAIYGQGMESTIVVKDAKIVGNSAVMSGCCGGGIFSQDSPLVVVRTLVKGNDTDGCCGGGIDYQDDDPMVIRDSTVAGNIADGCCGGGVSSSGGKLTISNSVVRSNIAKACCGGGISQTGDFLLTNSLVIGNKSKTNSGIAGGVNLSSSVSAIIENSTIANNRSGNDDGGATLSGTDLTMTNSTVSGNSAESSGGGLDISFSGTATLTHVTVFDNEAGDAGGGIYAGGGAIDILRSIVAKNSPDDCDAPIPGVVGKNLDKDGDCFTTGTAIHANPRLMPLGHYGSPDLVHDLFSNSPAIDVAPDMVCPPPGKDQRGVKRPQNGDGKGSTRCDLGAVEHKP